MDLVVFSVQNYRRFKKKTSVKLYGGMIAIVGPNEAGKTSLLNAMTHLNHDGGYERSEATRRGGLEPTLSWQLQLQNADKEALTGIFNTAEIEKATVTKGPGGGRKWSFHPQDPVRDRTPRRLTLDALMALRNAGSMSAERIASQDIDGDVFDAAQSVLSENIDDMDEGRLVTVRSAADMLRSAAQDRLNEVTEIDEEPSAKDVEYVDGLRAVAGSLDELATIEAEPSPKALAEAALQPLIPRIEMFRVEDRELGPFYDLNEDADEPPPALRHLALLAGLDLPALRDEANENLDADVSTRRNNANTRLLEVFNASWNQQEIAIQIEVKNAGLLIQATTPGDNGLSTIDERSEGMRWFAALLAFTHNWTGRPILLADEIETHLHYDAQSDLVNVLSAQEFTSKVIYTIHSFGCLPHDLGNGVRAVKQIDHSTSELSNSFWNDGAGFSPLLAVMGAAAVSFTPSRRAVVGEGPGEAILLPTLLRQASKMRKLDFQVVPGIAIVAAVGVSELETQAGRLAFIVDGDPGGINNKKKLIDGGISEDRIVVLSLDDDTPLELEDFVDPAAYAAAVNKEVKLWNKTLNAEISVSDLAPTMVTKSVEAWCETHGVKAPDKAAVAQRVVDLSHSSKSDPKPVYADVHKERLEEILHRFEEILDSYMSVI